MNLEKVVWNKFDDNLDRMLPDKIVSARLYVGGCCWFTVYEHHITQDDDEIFIAFVKKQSECLIDWNRIFMNRVKIVLSQHHHPDQASDVTLELNQDRSERTCCSYVEIPIVMWDGQSNILYFQDGTGGLVYS